MLGFLLSIEIRLHNGTNLVFEGSGSQELGRINYFSGWPMVSISPKQLVHASSVEELIQLLAKNVKDIEDDEVYIFTESNPVESDLDEETFDAYDFVQLIKDNVNDISDIASVSMISQEYGEFRFFRKYVYDIASDNYSCSMLGVTNSPCDNAEDEEEFADVADLYAGLIPTILQFADKSECTITQKERFCRDADEEDIYGFRGCIVERKELSQTDQKVDSVISDFFGELTLGTYPTGENGEPEKIEWFIIDKANNKALIISKNIIDFLPAHKKSECIIWEDSYIRKWLNKDFIKAAFCDEEKRAFVDAEEPIFLLSKKESWKYFTSNFSRAAVTTKYANAQREKKGKAIIQKDHFRNSWWVRNDDFPCNGASVVFSNGDIFLGDMNIRDIGGIRPTLWIDLNQLPENAELTWFDNCMVEHCDGYYIKNGVLTSISENALDVSVTKKVKAVGSHVTHGCEMINSIELPDGVEELYEEAFWCSHMKQILLPSTIKHIGKEAMYNCPVLSMIAIPSGVHSIGEKAFSICSSLEKILLPDSVMSIAPNTFDGCQKLKIYASEGSYAEQYAKKNNIPFVVER